MVSAFLGILGVLLILVVGEILWRFKMVKAERARALAHTMAGTFVAFWPFFVGWRAIQVVAALAFLAVFITRRLHIFESLYAVKRRTYGEFFFPLAVCVCALLTDVRLIFVAAILHLSLADGLASLIGSRFGGGTRYRILGQNKSWVGTGTFYITSLVIVAFVAIGNMDQFLHANVWLLALLPIIATAAESLGVYGTDDLTVPFIVLGLLQWLHTMH